MMMATVSSTEVASALTIALTHEEDNKVVSRKVIDILGEDQEQARTRTQSTYVPVHEIFVNDKHYLEEEEEK